MYYTFQLRGKGDEGRWIAARFEDGQLPKDFELGNPRYVHSLNNDEYYNRPLSKGETYRVFIRAYTTGQVLFTFHVLMF